MELRRKLQHKILVSLQEIYPDSMLVEELPGFAQEREFMGNLFYLQEHGLIAGGDIREPGRCRSMVDAQITKEGLDFLTDDGGLPAITGSSIVRFNHFEIVEDLDRSLKKSGLDEDERSAVLAKIRVMDAEGIKLVISRLVDHGISVDKTILSELLCGTENADDGLRGDDNA